MTLRRTVAIGMAVGMAALMAAAPAVAATQSAPADQIDLNSATVEQLGYFLLEFVADTDSNRERCLRSAERWSEHVFSLSGTVYHYHPRDEIHRLFRDCA